MSTLHLLSHPQAWPAAREAWQDGDSLLLTAAGVTLALTAASLPPATVALADAVRGRGLADRWPARIPCIDAAAWVALAGSHDRCVSWS